MKSFAVAAAAGAGVLLAGSAFAGPLTNGIVGSNGFAQAEQVRVVCDEYGRCFERRGARRVVIDRDSYNYEPRPRYQERRRYNDGPGIGVQVPGVSIGVGGGRW